MSVCYRVDHETRYVYASTVSTSQHVAYLRPRAMRRQQVLQAELEVDPRPVESSRRTDYFGNTVDQFTLLTPHTELSVRARSLVEVLPADAPIEPSTKKRVLVVDDDDAVVARRHAEVRALTGPLGERKDEPSVKLIWTMKTSG